MGTTAAHVNRAARRALADALTASRLVITVALAGRPAPETAAVLLAWAWVSDALDGPLARSAGRPGRLARFDHLIDAAVGVAVVWYLGTAGFWPLLPAVAGAILLLVVWAVTRAFVAQMLLLAVSYGAFLWWAFTLDTWAWTVLVVVALTTLVAEWPRFSHELVPGFLRGWRDLLVGRR